MRGSSIQSVLPGTLHDIMQLGRLLLGGTSALTWLTGTKVSSKIDCPNWVIVTNFSSFCFFSNRANDTIHRDRGQL